MLHRRTIESPDPVLAGVMIEEDADSFSFYAPRPRAYADFLRSHGVPLNVRGVRLVYPKNFNFIREMRTDRLRRLTKFGLDPQNLLVFEIPHALAFAEDLDPALAATDFQLLKRQGAYFRSMVFTDDYIDQTSPIDLEDTVIHEQMHLREEGEAIRIGNGIYEDEDRDMLEARTDHLVKAKLRAKYGDGAVDDAILKSRLYGFGQQARKGTLSSGLLNFWLSRFIQSRFESMKPSSLIAADALLHGRFAKQMEEDHERIREKYRELFNYHLNKD